MSKTVDELKNTSALLARSVPPSITEKLATEKDKALSQAVADITGWKVGARFLSSARSR